MKHRYCIRKAHLKPHLAYYFVLQQSQKEKEEKKPEEARVFKEEEQQLVKAHITSLPNEHRPRHTSSYGRSRIKSNHIPSPLMTTTTRSPSPVRDVS